MAKREKDPAATTLNGSIPEAAKKTIIRSFKSKPAQHVGVFVACCFMLSLLGYAANMLVDAYCDIRDRLATTEQELQDVESEAEGDVEEVKTATEDASAIHDSRLDILEMELGQLQLEIERLRTGDSPVDEVIRKAGDIAIEAKMKEKPRPRTDAVQEDGVVRFQEK